jgi:hypothetical protein
MSRALKAITLASVAMLSLVVALPASAEPTCTEQPKSVWMPEDAMKAKIVELGFKDIRLFKTTDTNCYEIYGYTTDSRKAEVYFNPVDGSIVQQKTD